MNFEGEEARQRLFHVVFVTDARQMVGVQSLQVF